MNTIYFIAIVHTTELWYRHAKVPRNAINARACKVESSEFQKIRENVGG